jgi:vesicular inhibitory amino acid transporter
MANSVNILLGVGLLSVPYALARGGWAGLGVLFLLGGVTNYTGKALVRCQDLGTLEVRDGEALPESFRSGDEDEEDWLRVNASESLSSASRPARRRQLSSYEDIGEAAFGRAGRTFITAVLYTELVGTCALFFILEGDHLALLFSGSGRDSAWFQAASACVMVPTLWLADLGALSYVGALGAAASVSLAGVVGYDLWMGTQGFTALPPGLADTSVLHASTLPVSFGLLAFVFAGHAVFPAIYASMETPEEYEPMLDATYAIVFATCLVIGGAGYALYGDAVRDEVTLNLPNGALSTLALALITINPLSKFALTMDPVARGLESVAGVDIRDAEGDGPLVARVLRTGLGMGSLLIAAKVPFFAVVMSLIGSFLTLTVSVVFPSACYLKMFGGRMSDAERVGNVGVILLGAFCAVAGSADAVAQITGKVAGG